MSMSSATLNASDTWVPQYVSESTLLGLEFPRVSSSVIQKIGMRNGLILAAALYDCVSVDIEL